MYLCIILLDILLSVTQESKYNTSQRNVQTPPSMASIGEVPKAFLKNKGSFLYFFKCESQ